jgi:hypothetical protein
MYLIPSLMQKDLFIERNVCLLCKLKSYITYTIFFTFHLPLTIYGHFDMGLQVAK